MGFASFTILVWDHIVTFSDEVEYIWKAKRSLMVYLFLINRYLTPLGFIVNLFAYLSPVWTPEVSVPPKIPIITLLAYSPSHQVCNEFIRFEGSMTVIGISIVAIMMFLRIKALYHAQRFVVWAVAFLWFFQTGIQAYLLTRGEAVVHNEDSGVQACTMIFDPEIILASSSAWLPLLYDTVIFGLTLYRTFPSIRHRNAPFVMKRLLEDGLIYYIAILAVTLVLTIMIIAAPPGLKNITAQLELLLVFIPTP
ncbi:hypothetical protein AX16_008489 [Volvariella volvacea WC 439]|nr:hypothetical protein AX16_008489 [Volvariella volvacea WC 439]